MDDDHDPWDDDDFVGGAIPEAARRAATPQAVRDWVEQVSQQLARDERRQRDEARETIRRQEEARETRETLRRRRPATRSPSRRWPTAIRWPSLPSAATGCASKRAVGSSSTPS